MICLPRRVQYGLFLLLGYVMAAASAQEPTAAKAKAEATQAKPVTHKTAHASHKKPHRIQPVSNPKLDRSGKARKGKASYYARSFAGKKMADGTPMNPNANIAASRTLPLGTKAQVTNLENGRSAVVEIRDRGPYVDGRIVDLSPKVAKKLQMVDDGVAPVVVEPIAVPQADGSVKPGDGAVPDSELAQEDAAR
jgi:rare lipoprotein A